VSRNGPAPHAYPALTRARAWQDGGAPSDWGRLLLGFLERFGGGFDYDGQAVAVARGGIVPKAAVPQAAVRDSVRLCVEDPLTGRCARAWRWTRTTPARVVRSRLWACRAASPAKALSLSGRRLTPALPAAAAPESPPKYLLACCSCPMCSRLAQ